MRDEEWLAPGAAARAAGVSRRSTWRWISLGLVPVRESDGHRYVQVQALKERARARSHGTHGVPGADAAPVATTRERVPLPPATAAGEEPLAVRVEVLRDLVHALVLRIEHVERHFGLAPPVIR